MKKCNSCNIKFNIAEDKCPLCQNKLTGKNSQLFYPKNIRFNTNILILKIVLFSSFVIGIISGFIELNLTHSLFYTFYISLTLLTNLVFIYVILKNSSNILKMLEKYGVILIVLILIWYLVTKEKAIPNYIIPIIALLELIFNFVCAIILKSKYLIRYSGLILINLFLLILPVFLVLFGLTTNNLMSYICLTLAIIIIVGLTIFFHDEIKEELIKLFNL